jgi:predicted transcriptional regulator
MSEKKISEMTIRLSDTLKRDAQDVAMYEDRKLSDIVRIALEVYIYGHKHRVDVACGKGDAGMAKRGFE